MNYEKKYLKYKLKYLSLLNDTSGGVAKLNKKKNLEKCIVECKNKYDNKLNDDNDDNDDSDSNQVFEGINNTLKNTGTFIKDTFSNMMSNEKENKGNKEKVYRNNLLKREEKLVLDKNNFYETSEKKNNRDKLFKKMNNHNNKKIKRSNNLKNEPDVPYGDSNLEYLYKKEKLLALVEHRKKLLKEKL
jgi:hypothetical protein